MTQTNISVTEALDLEKGDRIRINGEEWTVTHKSDIGISFKNGAGEEKHMYNALCDKWYDALDAIGFEFISTADCD